MNDVSVLIKRSQAGEKEAREVLIENNLGLVHHIVKRFYNRGYDLEDLFQIGVIGLMKAIDKFDITMQVQFSACAVPLISGEIKRFLRDDGMVKVSRSLKENGYKISRAREEMIKTMGREPTLEEISKATGIATEDIVVSMEANIEVESIYRSVYQNDGNEIFLVDKIPFEKDENEELLNHMLLTRLIDSLDEKERKLIILRYYHNKTQTEVANSLGISQVQVSRLEKKILCRMREGIQ